MNFYSFLEPKLLAALMGWSPLVGITTPTPLDSQKHLRNLHNTHSALSAACLCALHLNIVVTTVSAVGAGGPINHVNWIINTNIRIPSMHGFWSYFSVMVNLNLNDYYCFLPKRKKTVHKVDFQNCIHTSAVVAISIMVMWALLMNWRQCPFRQLALGLSWLCKRAELWNIKNEMLFFSFLKV